MTETASIPPSAAPTAAAAPVAVAAFYKFFRWADGQPHAVRGAIRDRLAALGLRGTLLLAPEGLNATLAGPRAALEAALADLAAIAGCGPIPAKWSTATAMPFARLKVRLKREIVTLGQPDADPTRRVGTYVRPQDWNALIQDPEVLVIDTRNGFEVAMGSFAGAVDPQTRSFGDFPGFARRALDPARHRKVAMFCTGGIRCEKASAFMLNEGFEQVFHLEGGILAYLEQIPAEDSLWRGGCFVFDERVALGHGLAILGPDEATDAEADSQDSERNIARNG